jgi:hypothetical protein
MKRKEKRKGSEMKGNGERTDYRVRKDCLHIVTERQHTKNTNSRIP